MRPLRFAACVRLFRALAASVAVILVAGGLPGAASRAVVYDLVAPLLPARVGGRDGAVDVTVLDTAAGGAASGAHVRALAVVGGRAYLADARDADAAGRALLRALPRGEAWVIAEAPGRARASTRLVVEAGTRAVTLRLALEHAIDVAVRDELGAPVARAEVEVAEPGEPLPVGARTGPEGRVRVGRLGAGPWRVTARAPGYDDGSDRVESDGGAARVVLHRLGALAVHVAGDGGAAAPGARVEVAGATLWPPRSADADAKGDVRIGGLAAGSYALRAVRGALVSPIELGVMLGRGEEKSVVLRLSPGRFVGVRVADGEGDDASPVPGARVSLAEAGLSPFPLEATTDARGHARLGPVAPGPLTVTARADGFVARGGVPVADPPPAETVVALVRAGVLTGRVVDAHGDPIDGATVEIAGTDPTGAPFVDDPRRASFQAAHFDAMLAGPAPLLPVGELGVVPGPVAPIPHAPGELAIGSGALAATQLGAPVEPWVTRDDGTFRAAPASPGRLRAIVHHPEYVEAESEVVTLAPGGEAHVEIVMHAGGTLEGTVVDAHDQPVEGARMLVAATRGSLERSTRTASDGTFTFAALPGEVSLSASADPDDVEPDARMTLAIPEGGRQQVTVRLPEPRDPLPVTVVDDRDFPVRDAQVSAASLSATVALRTTAFTDADGAAALRRARGVPLRVEVRAPGRAPCVVTTGASEDALRVELLPAEGATGSVVSARGRDPVAGAEVTLATDQGLRRARTLPDGSFTLGELAPGPASLRVRAAGFAPSARAVTIPDSGGRRAFEIPPVELAEEGSVEGEVVDANGDPVTGARVARDHVPTWLALGPAPAGIAIADAAGRFALHQLPEGSLTLEAYAPDVGRARATGVRVEAGRTTTDVRIVLAPGGKGAAAPDTGAAGNVAVTLGETDAPREVVIVSVADGSEAERAGLLAGDVLLAVDGAGVSTMAGARAKLAGPLADDVVVKVRRGGQTLTLRVTREAVRR